MTLNRSLRNRFVLHEWLTLLVFVLLVAFFTIYVRAEKAIDLANDVRLASLRLARELRQSSDELTRTVRTYVVTGEAHYKRQYDEILAIRNGEAPRPEDYWRVYWDLVGADNARPRPAGEKVAIIDLMRNAGFTPQEIDKLLEAKLQSDHLTRLEIAAMALIATPKGQTDAVHHQAIHMLHNADYHQAKAKIMLPLAEFERLVDQRTTVATEEAIDRAYLARSVLLGIGLLFIWMLWNLRHQTEKILGTSLKKLNEQIEALGRGDVHAPIDAGTAHEHTVLGKLADAQRELSRLERERLVAVDELRAHQEHLELLVTHRTAEANSAKEAAEAANQAKSVFLANMSHELRTPMHGILAMTTMAQKRAEDPKQIDLLAKLKDAATRLLSIINDILDVSKIEAHGMKLEAAPLHLNSVLDKVIAIVGPAAEQKGIAIETGLSLEVATTAYLGDALRLNQILVNLIGNAVKFTEQGVISVTGRIEAIRPEGHCLHLEVSDNGIGIAPEDIGRLFSSFEQVDASITRRYGGSGLGLSICKGLVEMMGGQIGVTSEPGVGSTFWFTVVLPPVEKASE